MIITGAEANQNQPSRTFSQNLFMSNSLPKEGKVEKFQPNDVIDWQVIERTLANLPSTILLSSSHGMQIQVSADSGTLLRREQTETLVASFLIGDALLFAGLYKAGPLTIVFEYPVFAVSTQLQSDTTHIPEYIASIEAFDNLDNSLGKIKTPGLSQHEGGGLVDVNFFDNKGRIRKLVINSKEEGLHIPFAINAMHLQTVN